MNLTLSLDETALLRLFDLLEYDPADEKLIREGQPEKVSKTGLRILRLRNELNLSPVGKIGSDDARRIGS